MINLLLKRITNGKYILGILMFLVLVSNASLYALGDPTDESSDDGTEVPTSPEQVEQGLTDGSLSLVQVISPDGVDVSVMDPTKQTILDIANILPPVEDWKGYPSTKLYTYTSGATSTSSYTFKNESGGTSTVTTTYTAALSEAAARALVSAGLAAGVTQGLDGKWYSYTNNIDNGSSDGGSSSRCNLADAQGAKIRYPANNAIIYPDSPDDDTVDITFSFISFTTRGKDCAEGAKKTCPSWFFKLYSPVESTDNLIARFAKRDTDRSKRYGACSNFIGTTWPPPTLTFKVPEGDELDMYEWRTGYTNSATGTSALGRFYISRYPAYRFKIILVDEVVPEHACPVTGFVSLMNCSGNNKRSFLNYMKYKFPNSSVEYLGCTEKTTGSGMESYTNGLFYALYSNTDSFWNSKRWGSTKYYSRVSGLDLTLYAVTSEGRYAEVELVSKGKTDGSYLFGNVPSDFTSLILKINGTNSAGVPYGLACLGTKIFPSTPVSDGSLNSPRIFSSMTTISRRTVEYVLAGVNPNNREYTQKEDDALANALKIGSEYTLYMNVSQAEKQEFPPWLTAVDGDVFGLEIGMSTPPSPSNGFGSYLINNASNGSGGYAFANDEIRLADENVSAKGGLAGSLADPDYDSSSSNKVPRLHDDIAVREFNFKAPSGSDVTSISSSDDFGSFENGKIYKMSASDFKDALTDSSSPLTYTVSDNGVAILYVQSSGDEDTEVLISRNIVSSNSGRLLIIADADVTITSDIGFSTIADYSLTASPLIMAGIVSSGDINFESSSTPITVLGPLVAKGNLIVNRTLKEDNSKYPVLTVNYSPRFLTKLTQIERNADKINYTGASTFDVQFVYLD